MGTAVVDFNMQAAIEMEKEKIRRKYLDSAEEIVSGYNRECELSKDYEGRQMFELLQNADDEAANSGGRVLVTFDGKTLSVSNTGDSFSFQGVKSLLYPSASPKKIHADKIGCKGLGFRSILTWAQTVTVAAEDFTIQFSKAYAQDFLRSILNEKPELGEEIRKLSEEQWPIATLTCPKICRESCLADGYSTSIVMECREELADTIEKQIVSLEFEELVFLPNLKEIEIICNDYHKVFYKVTEGDDVIIEVKDLISQTAECAGWRLFRQSGMIRDEGKKEKSYEFVIAYDSSGQKHGDVLYSYFKTDVKLKFPALIHGTFELTSDRNSLQKQSYVNQQLIPLLAEFMVQTAVKISEEQEECSYQPLSLVISSDMDRVLKDIYKLDQLLKEEVREKRIFPTIGNQYISIQDTPKYSGTSLSEILSPQNFPELLKTAPDSVAEYLVSDLKLGFYTYEDFCNRLNQNVQIYSLEERAELIALIRTQFRYKSGGEIFPHLLVDSYGNCISDAAKVFPLPNEEQLIALPEWADIRFLNGDLEQQLYTKLHLHNIRRELVAELSRYHMEEYSFDKLLRSVANQFDKASETAERCSDVLNWLWKYYNREDRQAIPDVRVKVICRDGVIRYARDCYLGAEYGNALGERLISLYSQNFVALEGLNIHSGDTAGIAGFLEWLGVARYPRIVKKTLPAEEQKEFLQICYPLYVPVDHQAYDASEFYRINEVCVGSVEFFDEILDGAELNDLLAWFVMDSSIHQSIYSDTEEQNSFSGITGWPGYKQNLRKVTPPYIHSYLRYYLSRKDWLIDEKGNKQIPEYCCFENNSLDPFIIVPKIDYGKIRTEVGRNCRKEVDAFLNRIGVADVFQELSNRVVYQTLMKLPELDPKCKLGRPLYRKIIKEGFSPEEYRENNPYYEQFIKEGLVPAKQNGMKKYVPVQQVRYADKKVFSQDILSRFSMFDADLRAGEEKIKKLFGVQPLKYIDVETDGEPKLHPLDDAFKKEYMRFIPYVFACRSDLKNSNTDFRKLKSSKVILCSNITIRYRFGTEVQASALKEYEIVYLPKRNTAYICLSKKYSDFAVLKQSFEFADAVAELITTILDVNEDKDFFRDLFRESDLVREKKMRIDKGDENLERLTEAKKRFRWDINYRDEFWMTLADIIHIPNTAGNGSAADEIINLMQLPQHVDAGVTYEKLDVFQNFRILSRIFKALEIDVMQYNAAANHTLDVTEYWEFQLKEKMKQHRAQYQVYLLQKFAHEENGPDQYEQCMETYDYMEPVMDNSFYADIDQVFQQEFDISFEKLDSYSGEKAKEVFEGEKSKINEKDWENLKSRYAPSKMEAYLLFGKIDRLMHLPEPEEEKQKQGEQGTEASIRNIAREVFAAPVQGFDSVKIQTMQSNPEKSEEIKPGRHQKKIHSELTDHRKQEIGMAGEACVFKELLALYPGAKWVSGNAEKAGQILKGDDTCGYDMKYTDHEGKIQYVEVKSSRNEDILFLLSDRELRFGCSHAEQYEIIYVVVGEDGRPAHQPWRLGHIFAFAEGEDLLHNSRFCLENDGYRLAAAKTGEPFGNVSD